MIASSSSGTHGQGCQTPAHAHHHAATHLPRSVADQRPRAAVPPGDRAPTGTPPIRWWRQVIAFLRRWSGDDAYERYLAEHHLHGHALLSRREFYRRYLDHRAGGSRCC